MGVSPPAASCRKVSAATGKTEASPFGKLWFVKAVSPVAAGGPACKLAGERPTAESMGAEGIGSLEEID
jgi:hypothetical protein